MARVVQDKEITAWIAWKNKLKKLGWTWDNEEHNFYKVENGIKAWYQGKRPDLEKRVD